MIWLVNRGNWLTNIAQVSWVFLQDGANHNDTAVSTIRYDLALYHSSA